MKDLRAGVVAERWKKYAIEREKQRPVNRKLEFQ